MKPTYILGYLCWLASLAPWGTQAAKLNVVASLPDFAALATFIGGDRIIVSSLAKGTEDAHFVDPRPSFVRVLNQADVLLEGGADLEVGWLPPLLQTARNPKIMPGKPGHVILSEGVPLLEVSGEVDRSQGDVHAKGNPHFWLDPVNVGIMAGHLADVLKQSDPANGEYYQGNLARFNTQLAQRLQNWNTRLAPYKGTRILTYHKTFEYLAHRFGLEIVGQLEPRPGLEPSPSHLNALIPRAKAQGVKLVIIEPFRARRMAETVAKSCQARLLILPEKVGGNEQAKDCFALMEYIVDRLEEALKQP